MRQNIIGYVIGLVIVVWLAGCAINDPTLVSKKHQITDGIANKRWKAFRVEEAGVLVYQEGKADNLFPGYRNYELQFTGSRIKLTEFTKETFEGDWSITQQGSRVYLILQNLTPIPTETQGELEYEVYQFDDSQMTLVATKTNRKTGNTINTYTLVPQ
ncbi:hypothetical protein [Spirosoma aerolatum]|uniref:hypothetical protein n=1 Tax=Spirosoma aerolatum TaxID=1211326 RepID=UPI0009AD7D5A|nr:hypothetical protein [Spirosoma aerolatum]